MLRHALDSFCFHHAASCFARYAYCPAWCSYTILVDKSIHVDHMQSSIVHLYVLQVYCPLFYCDLMSLLWVDRVDFLPLDVSLLGVVCHERILAVV
jgi:hypothetical protein